MSYENIRHWQGPGDLLLIGFHCWAVNPNRKSPRRPLPGPLDRSSHVEARDIDHRMRPVLRVLQNGPQITLCVPQKLVSVALDYPFGTEVPRHPHRRITRVVFAHIPFRQYEPLDVAAAGIFIEHVVATVGGAVIL